MSQRTSTYGWSHESDSFCEDYVKQLQKFDSHQLIPKSEIHHHPYLQLKIEKIEDHPEFQPGDKLMINAGGLVTSDR